MRRVFSSLAFALLSTLSLGAYAVPASPPKAPDPVSVQSVSSAQAEKVNLNTADAETLQRSLVGIGAAKAQAIVAYRDENGAFSSVDELLEVKGIGKSILDRNRENVVVK